MGDIATQKKSTWSWANRMPNNIYQVSPKSGKDFFRWWFLLIHEWVPLSSKELDVVSSFLNFRMDIAAKVPPEMVDVVLMSNETKVKVASDCNITLRHLYVVMSNLKKKKILTKKGISPRLIPNIRETDNGVFQFLILINETGLS